MVPMRLPLVVCAFVALCSAVPATAAAASTTLPVSRWTCTVGGEYLCNPCPEHCENVDPAYPRRVAVGVPVAFDGSLSSDDRNPGGGVFPRGPSQGPIVAYAWTFGDGGSAVGAQPTHTFATPGNYPVTLTVTDEDGEADSKTLIVEAEPAPPVARIALPGGALVSGTSLRFDGTGSTDFDGTVAEYLWSFGDGASATGPTPSHVYAAVTSAQSYQVTLTVRDDDGRSSVAAKADIVVLPPGPIARWTCSVCTGSGGQAVAGRPVTFDAAASTDDGGTGTPNGTIASYGWTFGDGGSASGITTSHAFADPGTYSVTLRVADNHNLIGAETKTVTVIAAGGSPTPPKLEPPALSSLRLTPKSPKATKAAKATVRFNLASAAAVSARLDRLDSGRRSGRRCVRPNPSNRRARRCVRAVKIAGRRLTGRQGANKVTIGSLSGRRRLIPGRYRVTLKTTAGTRTIAFRVVK